MASEKVCTPEGRQSRVRKPSALLLDRNYAIQFAKKKYRPGQLDAFARALDVGEEEEELEPSTPSKCRKSKLDRSSFTREEDEAIIKAVEELGDGKWSQIAAHAQVNRGSKAVRERYRNHLDPEIDFGPWTMEEDNQILAMYELHGSSWALIARTLKSRTDNQVKNRFNCKLRKEAGPLALPLAEHKQKRKQRPKDDEVVLDNLNNLEMGEFMGEFMNGFPLSEDSVPSMVGNDLDSLVARGPQPTAYPAMPGISIFDALEVHVTGSESPAPRNYIRKVYRAPMAATTSLKPGLHIRTVDKIDLQSKPLQKRSFFHKKLSGEGESFEKFNVRYKRACYDRSVERMSIKY